MRHFLSAVKESGVTKEHLKALGISSVFHITNKREKDFIKSTEGVVSEEQARSMYKVAKNIHNRVLFKALSAKTLLSKENFAQEFSTSSNGHHFIQNDVSYENVFGSLDYYNIDEDDSILSPAAYFVDLYNLIEQHIVFNEKDDGTEKDKQAEVYELKNRRPDLWNIKLDKEHTETLKSYLEIANNIVEQFLINYPNNGLPTEGTGGDEVLADNWALQSKIPFTQPLLDAISYLEYLGVKLADIYSLTGKDQADINKAILGLGFAGELDPADIQLSDLLNQVFNISDITSDDNNAQTIAASLEITGAEVNDDLFAKLAAVVQIQEQLDLSVTDVANLIYPTDEASRYSNLSNALGVTINEIKCSEQVLGYTDGENPDTPQKLLALIEYITWCKGNNINTYQVYYMVKDKFYSPIDQQNLTKYISSLNSILTSTQDDWSENFIKALSAQYGVNTDTIEVVIAGLSRQELQLSLTSIVRSLFTINCFVLSSDDVFNTGAKPVSFGLAETFAWNTSGLDLESLKQLSQLNELKKAYDKNITTAELSNFITKDTSNLSNITGYKGVDISTVYTILKPGITYPLSTQSQTKELQPERYYVASASVGNYAIFAGGLLDDNSFSAAVNIFDFLDPNNITSINGPALSEQKITACTTVGNYAIFAGGQTGDTSYSDTVEIYDFTDPTDITRTDGPKLWEKKLSASTSVGNYAIFAGGVAQNTDTNEISLTDSVDIYDFTNYDGVNSTSISNIKGQKLSAQRKNLAATTVGNYAVFGGGFDGAASDVVDIYDFSDIGNIKLITGIKLSRGRYDLSVTTVGNYVIFSGGMEPSTTPGQYIPSKIVDIYDFSTLEVTYDNEIYSGTIQSSVKELSEARSLLAGTSIGNYAIFAGGTGASRTVDIYDFTDPTNITRIDGIQLSTGRDALGGINIGNYAIFAGGYTGIASSRMDIFDFSLYLNDLVQFNKLVNIIQLMGTDINTFKTVYTSQNSDTMAQYITMQENASYLAEKKVNNDSAWDAIDQGIQKVALEKARNALVTVAFTFLGRNAYTYDITNLRNLYEYFLIDIQTSADTLISELKLGLNSLQTYIQRVLINLEPLAAPTSENDLAELWSWMASYRMWQANREVFLYPENYYDPALRQEATPQYQNLVQTLSQQQITQDNVNDAYSRYFHDVNELLQLDIVDYCYGSTTTGNSNSSSDTLFILGRTQSTPYQYYYRKGHLDPKSTEPKTVSGWDEWIEVTTQIPSPYVSIAYAFGRWFLFWVENTNETSSTNASEPQQKSYYATIKYIYMQVNTRWSTAQILQDKLLYAVSNATIPVTFQPLDYYNKYTTDRVWQSLVVNYDDKQQGIVVNFGPQVSLALTVNSEQYVTTNGNSQLIELNSIFKNAFANIRYYTNNNNDPNELISLFSYILPENLIAGENYLSRTLTTISVQTDALQITGGTAVSVKGFIVFAGATYSGDTVEIGMLSSDRKSINKLTSSLTLSEARKDPVGISVEYNNKHYVIFAAGYTAANSFSDAIDIFDFTDFDGTSTSVVTRATTALHSKKNFMGTTVVGPYVFFAGGKTGTDSNTTENTVEVLDLSDKNYSVQVLPDSLSAHVSELAATSVGNYAIFAGGYDNNSNPSARVDVYRVDIKNGQFTKLSSLSTLSESRHNLAATTVGNYAIFAGGNAGNDVGDALGTVDVFDFSDFTGSGALNRVTFNLLDPRSHLAAVTSGSYVMFAGGFDGSKNKMYTVDIYDFSNFRGQQNPDKVHMTDLLFQPQGMPMAVNTNGNILFMEADGDKNGSTYNLNALQNTKAPLSQDIIGNTIPSSTLLKLPQIYTVQGAEGLFNIRNTNKVLFNALMCNPSSINAANTLESVKSNLSTPRYNPASAVVGNYAIFAGGDDGTLSNKVDIFDFSQFDGHTSDTMKLINGLELSTPREGMAAASVGNYAIFAGGNDNTPSDKVDIFDFSQFDGQNIDTINSIGSTLKVGRKQLAATSVGNYAIFAGGDDGSSVPSKEVEIYDLSDINNNRTSTRIDDLSRDRKQLAATSVGNYAIFAGGDEGTNAPSNTVDIYDLSQFDGIDPDTISHWSSTNPDFAALALKQSRRYLTAASVGNYAIFAGGYGDSGYSDTVDIYDFTDPTNIKRYSSMDPDPVIKGLSTPRMELTATTVGNYVIFAGGYDGTPSATVDIYDFTDPTNIKRYSSTDPDPVIKGLLPPRDLVAAASVGNYAVFAGGHDGSQPSATVDIYDIDYLIMANNKDYCCYYRQYFYELFYHIPLFIADQLSNNDQFADAKTWYEYVFNPITNDNQYWNFGPFIGSVVDKLRSQLSNDDAISYYEEDPFDPEGIANIRPGAFEKFVVMKYIDNLIAWGDYLFSQYSWENIAHARMLYVTAYDLLGPKPFSIGNINNDNDGSTGSRAPKTLQDIIEQEDEGGAIPAFLIDLEKTTPAATTVTNPNIFNSVSVLAYFGVPSNDELANYWTIIEDRLYKIRNSQNINGVYQPLPLFQPPIDPRALVSSAASAYLSGGNDLYNPLDIYANTIIGRFKLAINQARNITDTVVQFGNSILSAYEKRDSETLAVLQENQSFAILNLMTQVKEDEIEQAEDNIASLNENLQSATEKVDYYTNLLNQGLSYLEQNDLSITSDAINLISTTSDLRKAASIAHLIPTIYGLADGGFQPGTSIDAIATALDSAASVLNAQAGNISKQASYERRSEEWQLQKTLAQYEQAQIQAQLDASSIALAIAKQNLVIHKQQIAQSQEKLNFYQTKFTNTQLYEWMYGQLLSVYNTAYRYAFSAYLAAVRSYQLETNDNPKAIATSNYYLSRKGILAGELLKLSINQLEQDYYAVYDNKANLQQLEKTFSLQELLEGQADNFEAGKATAQWDFSLTGDQFKDFPNLTCLRIKTISVTFPAILGPYQNIAATLAQNSYTINGLNIIPNGQTADPDNTTYKSWIKRSQIALSRNIDDSGLFQVDFHDDNYLPFEGTGAISNWTLMIHNATTSTPAGPIDLTNLSDIIVKVAYTAEGLPGTNAKNTHRAKAKKK